MRDGSDVLDGGHFDTEGLNGTHSGLTAGARTTKANFSFTETMAHRLTAGILSNDLSGVCGTFTGTTETHLASSGPADHTTCAVSDRDDGVVKGGVNVHQTLGDVFGTLGLDDLLFGGFTTDFEPDALGNLLVTTGGDALVSGCGGSSRCCARSGGGSRSGRCGNWCNRGRFFSHDM